MQAYKDNSVVFMSKNILYNVYLLNLVQKKCVYEDFC